MSEPHKKPAAKELPETQRASMLNFAAFGTAQAGLTVTTAFTALSVITGSTGLAAMFGASLVPLAGLCWLNYRHLKAYDGKPRPYTEPVERARSRCKDAFYRLAAPFVIVGATTLLASCTGPTEEQQQAHRAAGQSLTQR